MDPTVIRAFVWGTSTQETTKKTLAKSKPCGKLERSTIDPAVMSAFELETSTHEKTKRTLAKSNWETEAHSH